MDRALKKQKTDSSAEKPGAQSVVFTVAEVKVEPELEINDSTIEQVPADSVSHNQNEPRRASPQLWKLFQMDSTTGKQSCTLCKVSIRSDASSLQRHIELMHKKEFVKIKPFLKNNKSQRKELLKGNIYVPPIPKPVKPKVSPLNVLLTRKDLTEAVLGLCTTHHVPYSFFNYPEWRKISDALTDAITRETGKPCPKFSATNSCAIVTHYANRIRQKISEETNGRMVSLKIDGASKASRTLFSVNAQFMLEGVVTVRNLAVTSSNEANLSEAIIEILKKYSINLEQVVSVTGPNMIIPTEESQQDDEAAEDNETERDDEKYDSKLRAFIEEGCHCMEMQGLQCLRCAAHATQFCALEVVNDQTDESIRTAFVKVRDVVKFLNIKSNRFCDIFLARKIAMPRLDCPTRWLTTMDMVESLIKTKTYFEEDHITVLGQGEEVLELLSDDLWRFLKVYWAAMEPLKRAIMTFQKQFLTLSQFYEEWWGLKLLLKCEMEEYAKLDDHPYLVIYERLTTALATKELDLFDNDALHGCLYMDPRFQETMSNATKSRAKTFLKNLWGRKCAVDKIAGPEASLATPQGAADSETMDQSVKAKKLLEQYFGKPETSAKPTTKTPKTTMQLIDNLKLLRKPIDFDVKAYWECMEVVQPELYALYEIVFAIPPAQVSGEQATAALLSALTHVRCNDLSDGLKDILMVKLNYDLVPNLGVNEEQMELNLSE